MKIATIESIHAYLDEHPDDMEARLVIADWMEENGDIIGASGQRWQVDHGKWPDNANTNGGHGWHWFGMLGMHSDTLDKSSRGLNDDIIGTIGFRNNLFDSYRSRQDAERALAERLHELEDQDQ